MRLFSTFYLNKDSPAAPETQRCSSLLQLLLGTQVVGVATLLLTAVDGTGVQTGVTPERERAFSSTHDLNESPSLEVKRVLLLAADHLLAVVFLGQLSEGRLDDASSETQHQVEGGLCQKHQHNKYRSS